MGKQRRILKTSHQISRKKKITHSSWLKMTNSRLSGLIGWFKCVGGVYNVICCLIGQYGKAKEDFENQPSNLQREKITHSSWLKMTNSRLSGLIGWFKCVGGTYNVT